MDTKAHPLAPDRRRPWAYRLIVTVLVAAVAVLAWHQRGARHPEPAPRPSPTGRMILDQVCPVGTDRHRAVAVSFRLSNGLDAPVLVRRADPVAVPAALRAVQTLMTSGSCEQPLDVHADGSLAPGDKLLVIFQFEVPAGSCPRPVPVRARLTVEAAGTDRVSEIAILPDLCPAALAPPGTGQHAADNY